MAHFTFDVDLLTIVDSNRNPLKDTFMTNGRNLKVR